MVISSIDYPGIAVGTLRRIQALHHLIDPVKCVICGFDDLRAIQIDHINGGGAEENHRLHTYGISKKILAMAPEEARKEYQPLCGNCNIIKQWPVIRDTQYQRRRHDALIKLSGDPPKCTCGFSDIRALQADHIHGDGTTEQREIGNKRIFYKILRMEHPEDEYQVLCVNCNFIKEAEQRGDHYGYKL